MRKILCVLLCVFCFLSFCSFVDDDTIDVYTGNVIFQSSSYDVTKLSGSITYYLDNYEDICLTSGGGLFNGSNVSYYGTALIGGTEYNIRFSPRSELQIEQVYYSNSIARSTWVNYMLVPDVIPSPWELPELVPFILVILVMIVLSLIVFKGIIL